MFSLKLVAIGPHLASIRGMKLRLVKIQAKNQNKREITILLLTKVILY